jgi:ketosteroid isomerase-like protein
LTNNHQHEEHPIMNDQPHKPALEPDDLSVFVIDRLNTGDVDGLAALYEAGAVMSLQDGAVATGVDEIRKTYAALTQSGATFERGRQLRTLRTDDLALTSVQLQDGTITVEVARRQADGSWLWVLDRPNILG